MKPSELEDSDNTKHWNNIWDNYLNSDLNSNLDATDKENSTLDVASKRMYFKIGFDAVKIVKDVFVSAGKTEPKRILDLPCGSGRVTRHLRLLFPKSEIVGCDLYASHVDFCSENFGTKAAYSKMDLDLLNLGFFDLIFCGSLLTHLPLKQFNKCLTFLKRSLGPNGVAIITLEGRHTLHIQEWKWKLCPDAVFETARLAFEQTGFGFSNYSERVKETFHKNDEYGVALVSPIFYFRELYRDPQVRILNFSERKWNDHQDVLVISRPGINE